MADSVPVVENRRLTDTAEAAFRRIARRKLLERGHPEEEVEAKLTELLRKGLPIDPKLLDGP